MFDQQLTCKACEACADVADSWFAMYCHVRLLYIMQMLQLRRCTYASMSTVPFCNAAVNLHRMVVPIMVVAWQD